MSEDIRITLRRQVEPPEPPQRYVQIGHLVQDTETMLTIDASDAGSATILCAQLNGYETRVGDLRSKGQRVGEQLEKFADLILGHLRARRDKHGSMEITIEERDRIDREIARVNGALADAVELRSGLR